MGQRNGPRNDMSIPSLLEYKTIRLRDRYATPPTNGLLARGNEFSHSDANSRISTGQQLKEDSYDLEGHRGSTSSPQLPSSLASCGGLHSFSQMAQLPSSLASCGGLHSFSQMAQFLPDIYAQHAKWRHPLQPLSHPALPGDTSELDGALSALRPLLRGVSDMPESSLLGSSSSKPSADVENSSRSYPAYPIAGLESKGKACLREGSASPTAHSSAPSCKLRGDTLPPIARTQCTVHSDTCHCVHTKTADQDRLRKNGEGTGPGEPAAKGMKGRGGNDARKNDARRKGGGRTSTRSKQRDTKAGRVKPRESTSLEQSQSCSPAVKTSDVVNGGKTSTRSKQRDTKAARVKPPVSTSLEQSQSCSPAVKTSDVVNDDEEDSISSYMQQRKAHPPSSPEERRIRSIVKETVRYDCDDVEDQEEILYFHRLTSILHPPPSILPPLTHTKATHPGLSLTAGLGAKSIESDLQGWAKDGFIDDSTLRRAILLRNRALYSTSDVTKTAARDHGRKDPKEGDVEEMGFNKRNKELSEKIGGKISVKSRVSPVKPRDGPRQKMSKPQHIKSMTWQEVSPLLGPKKEKDTEGKCKKKKANKGLASQKKASIAAEALRHMQQKRTKHRDHSNCQSTIVPDPHHKERCNAPVCIPSLPPVRLFRAQDLSISCSARTSKSLTSMLGKEPNPADQQETLVFSSSYPRFITMFSQPIYQTRRHPSDQRKKKFEGHIDGMKVKRRELGNADTSDAAGAKSPKR